jgi:hypothetical protein
VDRIPDTDWKRERHGLAAGIAPMLLDDRARLMAQQPIIAIQTACTPAEVPIVSSLVAFCQYFGGALFVSLGTTVFTNQLVQLLPMFAPGVDPDVVVHAGATSLRTIIPKEDLTGVLLAANKALTQTFVSIM